jgi:zinc protease
MADPALQPQVEGIEGPPPPSPTLQEQQMSTSVPARPTGVRGRTASMTLALALVFSAVTSLSAQAPTAAAPAAQAPLPAGMTRGATVEGITEYTLANGLRVLLFPDQSKPTVTVNITYLVGSRHEGYGETGMAHLLEHLVFKGTPKHPNIPQELTEHGAFPNGTTWYDRTNYFETAPATDVNLDWALDLEADRMVNSFIAKKDLESEFTVVRNEFESGENSPFNVTFQRTLATAFEWHNYGKTTIGNRADLENVPIERLQAFYRKYYQPDNSILVVAGKFDVAKTLNLISTKFGPIPRPQRSLATGNLLFPTYTRDPAQDGEREVTVRRVGDTQILNAFYKTVAGTHADYAPLAVLSSILSRAPGGRLHTALVVPGHVANVGSNVMQFAEPGGIMVQASLRKEQSLDVARNTVIDVVEKLGANPPTDAEVQQAKTLLLRGIELSFTNSQNVALNLSEWASMGDWRMIFVNRDRIEAVKAEDVRRVATTYFKSDNRTIGKFVPTEKPDRVTIPVVVEAEFAKMTSEYKGRAAISEGEAFDPAPANIDSRTMRSVLPGGMKLALLPKETRGDVVSALITLRFGDERTLANRGTAARAMGPMLSMGTRSKTRQQIREGFEQLKSTANFNSSGNAIVVNVTSTRANLMPALALVAEVLREPVFPATEWEEMKRSQLAGMESQKSDPVSLTLTLFNQKLTPYPKGHPLATLAIDEQIEITRALTVDQIKGVYTELVGASHGDIAVSGDFDANAVRTWARATFDSWKSPKPFRRLERQFFDVAQFNESIETPDKANAFFFAGQNLRVRDDSPEWPALMMGNFVLGGGFLNSRLATRIRQRDGISYGVGSGMSAQQLDSVGQFTANAIYAPENILRLESAFGEEMGRILNEGITQAELDAAKSAMLQGREQNRSNDNFLVSTFSNQANTGRNMQFDAQLDARLRALTVEQVNAAIKKHISLSKISSVKAGDFKNKPATPLPTKP